MSPSTTGSAAPDDLPPSAFVPPATARNRALIAILLPLALALIVGVISGTLFAPAAAGALPNATLPNPALPNAAPIFAALGIAAWFVGLRFYGLRGLGLRGGRPLFAGIGFAVLAWVAVLIGRFLPKAPIVDFDATGQAIVEIALQIEVMAIQSAGSGRAFTYLLLFEAFAVQVWAFGLVFRALADWRGGLTAAIASGILFGATGFLLFREAFVPGVPALFYFLLWGVVYGVIRLRTGSILGPILVQALQSFTAWFVFQPPDDLSQTGIQTVYLAVSLLFVLIIWRLWPRRVGDYRV